MLKRCVKKCSTDGGISGSKKNTVAVAARTGRYTAAVAIRYTVAVAVRYTVAVRTGRQVHGPKSYHCHCVRSGFLLFIHIN